MSTNTVDRKMKYARRGKSRKTDDQVNVNLDIQTLDLMVRYTMSQNAAVRRSQLINLRNFITSLDTDTYNNDFEKSKRVSFIKKGLEGRILCNLNDPYMIMKHINGGIIDDDVFDIQNARDLSTSEAVWLGGMISEALKYTKMDTFANKMMDVCSRYMSTDYGSKSDILKEFESVNAEIQNNFRKLRNETASEITFSLMPGEYENAMYSIHSELSSPNRKVMTAMHGMNELLGGGFESGRVYVFLALPGEGKTTTIINLLKQMKKSNKQYRTKDPTKVPCIVLLTQENSVRESVSTLFSICTGDKRMTNYDVNDAISILKSEGELHVTDESPINILIKFVPNMTIDTSYLYTLTEDLEDAGMEVVAFFQDYIGRIRSIDNTGDTRLDLGQIVNEFKVFATAKDIPVITAAQLNRDASKHIDEGRVKNKADLVRLLGRSNISESMLILNNADGVFIIAPEWTQDGEKYLGIQRVKKRYEASARQYIYLPYDNADSINLTEDLMFAVPIFKTSLRSDDPDFGLSGGCGNARVSPYHTNKIVNIDQAFKDDGEHNIFKASTVVSSSNTSPQFKPELKPAIRYLKRAIEIIA